MNDRAAALIIAATAGMALDFGRRWWEGGLEV